MVKVMNTYIADELANKVHQLTKELIKAQNLIKILEQDNEEMKNYLDTIRESESEDNCA